MNTQPRMLKQKDLRKLMKKRKLEEALNKAARKIQLVWRDYMANRYYQEQEDYDDRGFGCDCGDWLCTGCGEGPYIACVMCGDDCRGGDYERWHLCSRRCMVREGRD
jgi:hypothetical protein